MFTVDVQPDAPSKAKTSEDRRPRAVVIGAGFGGLAAAVRLNARGYSVTVVERLEQVGGRASVFRQDGFTFDAGPTIVTAPWMFEELWSLAGENMSDHVTLKRLDPLYKIRFADGSEFRCFQDDADMEAEVARLSPGDVDGYKRLAEACAACFEAGFEGMVDQPFNRIGTMISAAPKLLKHRADQSIHTLVAKHVRDPRLRMALSFHPLFIGGNPFRASAILGLIPHLERAWGVHYAMGGTGALAHGIAEVVKRQGGEILLQAEVDEILTDGGRASGVRLVDGRTLPAEVVVSNADVAWTYGRLLRNHVRRRWTDRKLARAAYSMSLFIWYFGVSGQYPDVDHHTILMGPRYKELLRDIFDRKRLADDFSLYLHRPTASDPSVAPAGDDAFYVLAPVPNLDGDVDWTSMAEPYRAKIEAALEATVLPGLRDRVVTSKVFTPLDFHARLHAEKGAAFGMEPKLTQTAWFRPHNLSEELEGLYIVGAGAHPGAGLPGVVASARILDKVVPDAVARP